MSEPTPLPKAERLPIAVRAYAHTDQVPKRKPDYIKGLSDASEWTVIFDTETTTDAAQRLRFGTYQVRKGDELRESGLFFDGEALTDNELGTLIAYGDQQGLELLTLAEFIENVFFKIGYELRASIVGFNLPFDISRLALDHSSARLAMRGGFSFKLSPRRKWPRVQVKHLSRRAALIQFNKPPQQTTPRGMRKKGDRVPTRRGFFVDVKTLAAALTSKSLTLGALAELLDIPSPKMDTEEHGVTLTPEYIAYAVRDTETTWECFAELRERYRRFGLTKTATHHIYSEASLGKAYLKQMGVRPWREVQPEFPPELIGNIMSSYFGGRAEVHIRRVATQVHYCDFLSMYPTVCTLMGLWKFVIAEGVDGRDATADTKKLLNDIEPEDLQRPDIWASLCVLVQVQPEGDILPVRAKYGGAQQNTIGLNHLTSKQPLWYTLADCIASKLLIGKSPKVIQAIEFAPQGVQSELAPVEISGNPEYHVDPAKDDFYRRLIDLRTQIRSGHIGGKEVDRDRQNADQSALKILANATSYGIFVELNAKQLSERTSLSCFGSSDRGFQADLNKFEEPGRYFHPLLATLITGAARLMLAITERLTFNAGLDWVFCDTDSMAIAKPKQLGNREFIWRAESICNWFIPLNPYDAKGPLIKIEDANYGIANGITGKRLKPLQCFAISAKRYALFNIGKDGKPEIRKASAHGHGHLLPPYAKENEPQSIPGPITPLSEIGVERWQHDFWYCIVKAALEGHPDQLDLSLLPEFDMPVVSRYAATTPELLQWFRDFNADRPYQEQVRPFGFLLALQAEQPLFQSEVAEQSTTESKRPKPIAPFTKDPVQASRTCFDRDSGEAIDKEQLKSYRESLAQYHLHPENKFANGDYTNSGAMQRRHIEASLICHIGKEANRWEEQLHLGYDTSAQLDYGVGERAGREAIREIQGIADLIGVSSLSKTAGLSRQYISSIINEKIKPPPATIFKILSNIKN